MISTSGCPLAVTESTRDRGDAVAVSVFQMSVEPGLVDLLLVDLSGGGEIGLGQFPVDHVSVHVYVVELVVLTDTLGLVVEGVDRLVIVDPDVVDGLRIVDDVLAGQVIVRRKGFFLYVVKLVRVLGVLDISLQILSFLC